MSGAQDLHAYLRGVSMPAHQYARLANAFLHATAQAQQPSSRPQSQSQTRAGEGQDEGEPCADAGTMHELATCTRAYTRVVLRLRAQAEAEARRAPPRASASPARDASAGGDGRGTRQGRGVSRVSSRAPSPASSFSHGHSYYRGGAGGSYGRSSAAQSQGQRPAQGAGFHSPLFRLRRAPLLQVFVPSPEGDWLSDTSVLACEGELKKAGVLHLMRAGDVVWDVAVGDEANVGRMVWDGGYLLVSDFRFFCWHPLVARTWSKRGARFRDEC